MGDSPDIFGDELPENDSAASAAELEAAGQSALFGGGETEAAAPEPAVPEKPNPAAAQPYRVLARKYRPQTFAELIGQEPMVQTLANAIKRDRLAHAFLMTGCAGSARPVPRG
jgi:DNA polymerase III subunit gamma/tau